jgi:hypothetical protein
MNGKGKSVHTVDLDDVAGDWEDIKDITFRVCCKEHKIFL